MHFLRAKIDLTTVALSASAHKAGALAAFGRGEQGDRDGLYSEWLTVRGWMPLMWFSLREGA